MTARRRSESITNVPISVTAQSGADLATKGVVRIDDLQRSTPSLKMTPSAGRRSNSEYEIRGINTTESLITEDPAVGVYVNEVYRARATGTNQTLYDVDNVQVLYGPQGTLFGRNSSAGAVLINTKQPTNRFGGEFDASYGSLGRYELTGIVNVPVNDELSIRVAGQRLKSDGYGTDITTHSKLGGSNVWSGRASILFKPTSHLQNLTVVGYYRAHDEGSLVELYGFRPCPAAGASAPVASCGPLGAQLSQDFAAQQARGPYQVAYDPALSDFHQGTTATTATSPFEHAQNLSVTNSTTYNLSDRILIKNIFGYNSVKLTALSDLDGTPIKLLDQYYATRDKQYSDEIQLQGKWPRLDWVAGALFFRETGHDIQEGYQNVVAYGYQNLLGINKSYAVFAQGTYKLTSKLSATLGGRYSWDERYAAYNEPQTQIGAGARKCTFPSTLAPNCFYEKSVSFGDPTYTFSLDYHLTRDTMFYVAHRRGYRSGGLQARVATTLIGFTPFKPEIVRDLEFGYKGNYRLWAGGRLTAQLALYEAWYKDIQKQTTIATGIVTQPTTTVIANAASAHVRGFEAEMSFSPIPQVDLSAYWGYVDGVYDKFATSAAVLQNINFPGSKNTAGATLSLIPVDRSDAGRIVLATNFSVRSRYYGDSSLPIVEPESRVPAQRNVNMTLSWQNILGTRITAEGWVRNLGNQVHILGTLPLASSFGIVTAVVGEPRTYGLTLKYSFGS